MGTSRESDDPLLFVSGRYAYTPHLLEFQVRRLGVEERVLPALEEWSRVVCPMPCQVWEWYLRDHPDAAYRDYIIQGLQRGIRVGFQYGRCHCTGASANMQLAVHQLEVIDEYLAREVRLGALWNQAGTQRCRSIGSGWFPRTTNLVSGVWWWTCRIPRQ